MEAVLLKLMSSPMLSLDNTYNVDDLRKQIETLAEQLLPQSLLQDVSTSAPAGADLLTALRAGGHILYFRHADTDHRSAGTAARHPTGAADQRAGERIAAPVWKCHSTFPVRPSSAIM